MDTLTMRQSSPIYVPSGANNIEDWLISLRQAFPVRPSLSPDGGRVPWTPATSGLRRRGLLGKYDPVTASLRTFQVSFRESLDGKLTQSRFLETLSAWGMTRSGELWALETLERPIAATAGGVWPTPQSVMAPYTTWANLNLVEAVALWPMPHASQSTGSGMQGRDGGPNLQTAAEFWMTPDVPNGGRKPKDSDLAALVANKGMTPSGKRQVGLENQARMSRTPDASSELRSEPTPHLKPTDPQLSLHDQAAQWATWRTPRANDYKGGVTGTKGSTRKAVDYYLPDQVLHAGLQAQETKPPGGASSPSAPASRLRLNPRFVEWLMNLPIGWLNLEPLETASFQQWLQSFCDKSQSDKP